MRRRKTPGKYEGGKMRGKCKEDARKNEPWVRSSTSVSPLSPSPFSFPPLSPFPCTSLFFLAGGIDLANLADLADHQSNFEYTSNFRITAYEALGVVYDVPYMILILIFTSTITTIGESPSSSPRVPLLPAPPSSPHFISHFICASCAICDRHSIPSFPSIHVLSLPSHIASNTNMIIIYIPTHTSHMRVSTPLLAPFAERLTTLTHNSNSNA